LGRRRYFHPDGGEISGNLATDGGGVDVSWGTFIMNGGTISHNISTKMGGGVFVYDDGTFTMNGGTIARNRAEGTGGGGVALNSEAIFTKNANGIIYGYDGGENANISENGFAHAAIAQNGSFYRKRDMTAGQGAVMRWPSVQPTADGWDSL